MDELLRGVAAALQEASLGWFAQELAEDILDQVWEDLINRQGALEGAVGHAP